MNPIARTTAGPVRGLVRDGVRNFRGIPYAQPPVGDLRWCPPRPPEPWAEVREATEFGKVAVQTGGALESLGAGGPPDYSEDCLYLNVQTPDAAGDSGDSLRPVMVWIHGGSFANGGGSIPWYNGRRLVAEGDVVVVTINYRLGILGWLAGDHLVGDHLVGDGQPSGYGAPNLGLLDQIEALKWVRDNIAEFGGDPDSVTLFGESAGAMSIGTLMATPAAAGLFHKVILQSGAGENAIPLDTARRVADATVAEFGSVSEMWGADPAEVLRVQNLISERAMRGQVDGLAWTPGQLPYGPVVDGDLLPALPIEAIRAGSAAALPTLIGTNRDEWALFTIATKPPTSDAELLKSLGRVVDRPSELLDRYRSAHPEADLKALRDLVFSDFVFRLPALRLAEAQLAAGQEQTYVYRFDVASTAFGGALGSCHGLEIPFVFNLLDGPGVQLFTGPDAPLSVAEDMSRAWVSFAISGDPAEAGAAWPAYRLDTRPTRVFSIDPTVDEDPGAATRTAWR